MKGICCFCFYKHHIRMKVKKILHLFIAEKFTGDFIYLVNKYSQYKHMFWVYGENYLDEEKNYLKQGNVKYIPRIDIKLNKDMTEKQMETYDSIILHGLFDYNIIEYLYRHKELLKKVSIYFWGGDIPLVGTWKNRFVKKYVIKNARSIITIIPKDYESLKTIYSPKGQKFIALYPTEQIEILSKLKEREYESNDKINILVGNSATVTNNHLKVMDLLSRFKDNDINIYVPLSYGDKDYAEEVIEYGKRIFGNKLIPIRDFMPLEEYSEFLNTMDIAIFNMVRQQALGNIFLLLYMGCKVYLHPEGKLLDYFRKMDFFVIDTKSISDMSISELREFSSDKKQHNKLLVHRMLDREKSIKTWENIFFAC